MIRIALTRRWVLLCSAGATGLILLLSPAAHGARYALLVGNASAGASDASLKYVDNDILAMNRTLSQICGFDQQNITSLYNAAPADLDRSIDAICTRLKQGSGDDLFLFYYSGHADEKNLKMGSVPYSLSLLRERFKNIPAQIRIGVFDACQSGSFTRLKGGTLAEPFLFPGDTRIAGQVILSSSSENEGSQESDGYRSSVFTFHFVNGLRGGADASGDRRVTLNEAYQYAYNRTVTSTARSSGGVQHPGYQFSIQGEGEIVLADLTIRTTGVILSKGIAGEITISNREATPPVALTKEGASAVMIALDPGDYQVSWKDDGADHIAEITVTDGKPAVLNAQDFKRIESRGGLSKGDKNQKYHTRFSFFGTGAYQQMDLQTLGEGLSKRYDDYEIFNQNPQFSFPDGVFMIGGGIELWIRELIPLTIAINYSSLRDSNTSNSTRLNPFDNKYYKTSFTYSLMTQFITGQFGSGIRIRSGVLKNVSLHYGLSFQMGLLDLMTRLDDSLYNVSFSQNGSDYTTVVLPYITIAYRYPIWGIFDIGIKVGYRYQGPDEPLSGWGLLYEMGGIDAAVFISTTPGR